MKVACALVLQRQKILLAKRPAWKSNGGLWEFPGGKLESQESAAEALKRELLEELALPVETQNMTALGTVCNEGIELISFLLASEHPILPKEHEALAWVKIGQLPHFSLCPNDKLTLSRFSQQILKFTKTA